MTRPTTTFIKSRRGRRKPRPGASTAVIIIGSGAVGLLILYLVFMPSGPHSSPRSEEPRSTASDIQTLERTQDASISSSSTDEPAQTPVQPGATAPAAPASPALPVAAADQDAHRNAKTKDVPADGSALTLDSQSPESPLTQGWVDDKRSHHSPGSVPAQIHNGWFTIKTAMPTLPTVRCDYRIPLDATERPLPTAADIVLLFPYPTETASIEGIASALTTQYGFTTISIRYPGMGPNDGIEGNDHKRWYYYPESGSGEAWMEAIRQIRRIGNFPNRPVFVTGRSGGGSAAGLFADAYPQQVAAVANEAGRLSSDELRFKGPILVMHGAHDYVSDPIKAYVKRAQKAQVAIVRITYPADWGGRGNYPIWQHCIYGVAEQAMWRWIADLADMRIDAGSIPPMTAWPMGPNNQPSSSSEFSKLASRIVMPAQSYMVGGDQVTIAIPPVAIQPRGCIVLAACGQMPQSEEITLDCEFFADHGWMTVSACSDSATAAANVLHRAFLQPNIEAAAGLPTVLVVDDTSSVSAFLTSLPQQHWIGIAICQPRSASLSRFLQGKTSPTTPVLAIGSQALVSSLSSQPWGKLVQMKSISFANFDQWHGRRCEAILDQVNQWESSDHQ